jgi:hypothetical protein
VADTPYVPTGVNVSHGPTQEALMKHSTMMWLALVCAMLFGVSCVLDAELTDTGNQAGEDQQEVVFPWFSRSDFPFVTTVKDDGKGKGGGWQEAKANLEFWYALFPRRINRWKCPFTVKMPIRTQFMGRFSPRRAAEVSAEIANDVARHMDYELPPGIFCHQFTDGMDKMFKSTKYRRIGGRIVTGSP